MDKFFNFLRKGIVLTMMVIFAVVFTYVPQYFAKEVPAAEAQWIVHDLGLNLKEFALDNVGFMIAKAIVSSIIGSLIKWINSGFKGSPAFVSDFKRFILDAADKAAGKFIRDLGGIGSFICSPFKLDIQVALALQYQQAREHPEDPNECRLSGIVKNLENFYKGTFSDASLSDFFSITSNPEKYTPYGQLLTAQASMRMRLINAKGQVLTEADWGGGFLSGKFCELIEGSGNAGREKFEKELEGYDAEFERQQEQRSVQPIESVLPPIDLSGPTTDARTTAPTNFPHEGSGEQSDLAVLKPAPVGRLAAETTTTPKPASGGGKANEKCKITTPGKVFQEATSFNLDTGRQSLVEADEINELVGALISQLANQAILGAAGLLGLSANTSGGGSYLDSATKQASGLANTSSATAAQAFKTELNSSYKVQEDAVTAANAAIPALLRYSGDTKNPQVKRDQANAAYNDAVSTRNKAMRDMALIPPIGDEFYDLDTEFQNPATTDARKQEISRRMAELNGEFVRINPISRSGLNEKIKMWQPPA